MLQSRQNRDHRRQPISAYCAPTNTIPTPWISHLDSHISEHCMIYTWNMNYATFFLHRRSPKDRCPAHPPVLPGLASGYFAGDKKIWSTHNMLIPLYSRVLLFPPDGKPTMGRLVGMDVGRKSATDHQLEGNPSIFKTIEYLMIDTRHWCWEKICQKKSNLLLLVFGHQEKSKIWVPNSLRTFVFRGCEIPTILVQSVVRL